MVPQGVTVDITPESVSVKGPKGSLSRRLPRVVTVQKNDGMLTVAVRNEEDSKERALWGTISAHVKNMLLGVTKGFVKQLEINGVGYKFSTQGAALKLEVGYSHPVMYQLPQGLSAKVEKNILTLESADKELLGKTAAEIRGIRKPEPYKGKGIKYVTETIRRKAGKAAKAAA